MFFLHHPGTPQAVKLKLSDYKEASLRYILQGIPARYILICYHGNKITQSISQDLASIKVNSESYV